MARLALLALAALLLSILPTLDTPAAAVEAAAPCTCCTLDESVSACSDNPTEALPASVTECPCPDTDSPCESAGEDVNALAGASTVLATCGENYLGQLGLGNNTDRKTLTSVPRLTNITRVACGDSHTLALRSDGTVWACGDNFCGQLGLGDNDPRTTFQRVPGLTNVIAIAAGGWHSLALKRDGMVWSCGKNAMGQLGLRHYNDRNTFAKIAGPTNVVAIAAGGFHSLLARSDGTVWTCGDNSFGQLGQGDTDNRNVFKRISGLTHVTAVAAGFSHSLLRRSDGTVWACGWNNVGQAGLGDSASRNLFARCSSISSVIAIASRGDHTLALRSDHTVWATGQNGSGQLGLGTTTRKKVFTRVPFMSGVTGIATGYDHSLLMKTAGGVWACGKNDSGQLGLGDFFSRNVYSRVQGVIAPTAIAGGRAHTVVVKQPIPVDRLPFSDNFNDGNMAGWTVVDEGTTSAPSRWRVSSGRLYQTSSIRGGTTLAPRGTWAYRRGATDWTNYRLQVDLKSSTDGGVGVLFRYQDKYNFYRFDWNRAARVRRLVRRVGGVEVVLARDNVAYVKNTNYRLEVSAYRDRLQVRINGALVFNALDKALSFGAIALWCHGNPGASFDNVYVQARTSAPFSNASLPFGDSFGDGKFNGWSICDDGTANAPSQWRVVNGQVVQSSAIAGTSGGRRLGTWLYLPTGAGWHDYRLRAKLRSTDADWIGLLFRYQNPDNFYRFEWSRVQSRRRLVRRVNGTESVLDEDTTPFALGTSYSLDVSLQGSSIQVKVNGALVLEAVSPTFSSGTVALWCSANTGAQFDNVSVTAP